MRGECIAQNHRRGVCRGGRVTLNASALLGTTSKVSVEGEAIPSLRCEVAGDGKGSPKMRWSTELAKDLQHKLALLRGRLINIEEATTFRQAARVDEAQHLVMLLARVVEVEMKADHSRQNLHIL